MIRETEQALEASIRPLGGNSIIERSDRSVLMTIPRNTSAMRQQREANGETGQETEQSSNEVL